METLDAYKKRDDDNIKRKNEIVSELPRYVKEYLSARSSNTTTNTQLQYAYSIRKFFVWLKDYVPELHDVRLKDINISYIRDLQPVDINDFMEFLGTAAGDSNTKRSKKNKMSALSSFFAYLVKNRYMDNNPCKNAEQIKIVRDKRIVRLSYDEAVEMLERIRTGDYITTEHQRDYLEKNRIRDYAIISLLLGTGIRVSECAFLDIEYVNLDKCQIHILRKGGKHQDIFLSDSTVEALADYIEYRKTLKIVPGSEHAFFISMQGRRMTVQSIEGVVKKFTKMLGYSTPDAVITPHKLRKTYGTELYRATGDIYLVAGVLGHEEITTTAQNYVADNVEQQKEARNIIQFGKKKKEE